MIYVYDVVLNLNSNLIEYFEWEEKDNIKYIRKIPFYKISKTTMNDFIKNNVVVEKEFLDKIYDKCKLEENYNNDYKYLCLFTDGNLILGVFFNKNGENKLISRLLLDEEDEILLLGNRLSLTNVNYSVKSCKEQVKSNLTRSEEIMKKTLEKELKTLYDKNLVDKLNYFYFEYFNKINNNKEMCYKELIDSLNNNFNKKRVNLYNIMKMCLEKR